MVLLHPRHALQSLSPPLTLIITPTNSHPPQVSAESIQLTYVENGALYVLNNTRLSDMDETCTNQTMIAAWIEIITSASDNAEELLQVLGNKSNIHINFICAFFF